MDLTVILGGVMPALIYFVNVVSDAGALMVVRGADFLSAFNKRQRDTLVMLLLRLHDHQNTAAEILWGLWLLRLAMLVYWSRFDHEPQHERQLPEEGGLGDGNWTQQAHRLASG